MAYADQQGMSSNRMISIIVVVLLHAFLGYALVTGLAFEAVKKVAEKMDVIDVEEEKPKEEEPPPPPPDDVLPPPPKTFVPDIYQRPSENQVQGTTQQDQPQDLGRNYQCWDNSMVQNATQCRPKPAEYKCWNNQIVEQPSQCPPEPKKENKSKKASPSNSKGSWVTTADYPESEVRAKRQGVTSFTVTVDAKGRVQSCSGSGSGSSRLDSIACQKIKSRARFNPALDSDGNPTTGTYSSSILWQLPKE